MTNINDIINNKKTFIIAEAGVNHNGSLKIAKKLVKEAKICGADAIKFQTFKAESVTTRRAEKAKYQKLVTDPQESQFNMLKKLELPFKTYPEIINYCKQHEINFLSTPYNFDEVDFLNDLDVFAFKLASIHIVELTLLRHVAQKGKPIFLSTGMATLSEIDEAVHTIWNSGNKNLILLQCTTNYPSKLEDANLKVIHTMKKIYNIPIGYSDHTIGHLAPCISVALGASVIEKHFTLDKKMKGPDHSTSADPEEFKRMVEEIRKTEVLLGSSIKHPSQIEQENAIGMRRSIVLTNKCIKGHVLTAKDLIFKRPGTGLKPRYMDLIIGKKVSKDLEKDHLLTFKDINWDE